MPPVYQQAFAKYRLAIIKLRDLKGMRLEVFRRINQGGTPLSGQDIRLVGVYDKNRQASRRFVETASEKFGLAHPWTNRDALGAWLDMWKDKDISRGQTASEMFLWSLMTAQHNKINGILQNTDALGKLNVRFSKGIDEALDVYCAQLHYQDKNPIAPPSLITFNEMKSDFFPYFEKWIGVLGSAGPSLDVRKNRTVAALIGAGYRENARPENLNKEALGRAVEFIRRPTDKSVAFGVEWPQSKGRWDGTKGYRAQMEAACQIVRALAKC